MDALLINKPDRFQCSTYKLLPNYLTGVKSSLKQTCDSPVQKQPRLALGNNLNEPEDDDDQTNVRFGDIMAEFGQQVLANNEQPQQASFAERSLQASYLGVSRREVDVTSSHRGLNATGTPAGLNVTAGVASGLNLTGAQQQPQLDLTGAGSSSDVPCPAMHLDLTSAAPSLNLTGAAPAGLNLTDTTQQLNATGIKPSIINLTAGQSFVARNPTLDITGKRAIRVDDGTMPRIYYKCSFSAFIYILILTLSLSKS